MSDESGTIKTRSGIWDWELKTFGSWPKSKPTGRRLGFKDPDDPVNTMSLSLEPEYEEFSEKSIQRVSLTPVTRRFADSSGDVWIARPLGERRARVPGEVLRVTLHNLKHGSKTVELPPGRVLGDLKNKELVDLLQDSAQPISRATKQR